MEAEKKKRCKHDLVEGTCSLCAGVPRTKDYALVNLIDSRGAAPTVLGPSHGPWLALWEDQIDDELVQESACSLL